MMTGSLRGLKVLDFSTLLPGPMATLFLAEAGAEVIKIERPETGEDMRYYPPTWGDSSVNFSLLNRGKKSVTVDLKNQSEREKLIPLIEQADIFVEQFRPGVMARLGLDYESIVKINPKIIYCSISGFGQDGPKQHLAGHDINYVGDAGLLSLGLGSSDNPVVPPALIADIGGGSYPAVINILLALRERDLSGKGCYIDVAMTDGVLPFLWWALGKTSASGASPENGNDRLTGGSPRYQLYTTRDQRFVAAGPLEDKFWAAFVEAIGLSEKYRNDSVDPQETIHQVALIIKNQSATYWEPILKKANCCCSIVKNVNEALKDEQFRDRGVFDNTLVSGSGDELPAVPIPIVPGLKSQDGNQKSAPLLGEHNNELLK
jgi:alpha-methylacyl-CoA racemase